MKAFKLFILALCLGGTPLMITACDEPDTVGEQVEEAGEEIGDEIDDATTN